MAERRAGNSKATWLGAVTGALALAILGWWVYQQDELEIPPTPATLVTAAPEASVEPEAEAEPPAPSFPVPVPETPPGTPPLPDLDGSDDGFLAALGEAIGSSRVGAFLLPTHIIQRLVIFIDNLDRAPLPLRYWPIQHTPGAFVTDGTSGTLAIDAKNGARYEPAVAAFEGIDADKAVAVYFRFYPLFQEAYRQVGYPDRQFNDRLVQIIDHLMAAPDVPQPVKLVRPKVVYQFADPELEKLSSGQKAMIRIGPANEARVKAKLRVLRAALTARSTASAAH